MAHHIICTDHYNMGVDGGDSGGPIFVQDSATQIRIAGLVFGRQDNLTMLGFPFSNFAAQPGNPTFSFCAAGFGC